MEKVMQAEEPEWGEAAKPESNRTRKNRKKTHKKRQRNQKKKADAALAQGETANFDTLETIDRKGLQGQDQNISIEENRSTKSAGGEYSNLPSQEQVKSPKTISAVIQPSSTQADTSTSPELAKLSTQAEGITTENTTEAMAKATVEEEGAIYDAKEENKKKNKKKKKVAKKQASTEDVEIEGEGKKQPGKDEVEVENATGNRADVNKDAGKDVGKGKGIQKAPEDDIRSLKFDDMTKDMICRKARCGKMTNCWDAVSVICPACGPYSIYRWCCAQHLYDDLPFHWAQDCGTGILKKVDEDTIRPRQLPIRPFVKSLNWDSPERHRQAIYNSCNLTGDYFIFADINLIPPGSVRENPLPGQYMAVRGKGDLWMTIKFPDDNETIMMKKRFQTLLRLCLSRSVEYPALVRDLVMMIRAFLRQAGQWTSTVVYHLSLQMTYEMHHIVPMDLSDEYWIEPAGRKK